MTLKKVDILRGFLVGSTTPMPQPICFYLFLYSHKISFLKKIKKFSAYKIKIKLRDPS